MTCPENSNDPCSAGTGNTISEVLSAIGPRTVEGDFGRVTTHSIQDAIAAAEYQRKRCALSSRSRTAGMLRSMSYRLVSHDGPAS